MQINIKVSTSWHYRYLWKWQDMSKVPKGNWQYVCDLLRRKCHNCFCVLLRCKTFTYFTSIQPCLLCVTRFSVIATLFDVVSCIFKLKDFECFLSLILLCPIHSLNWVIKLSLNWVTVSLLEIVRRCIPENNLVGQLDHTVGFIDSFQFCVSLIALYSYL